MSDEKSIMKRVFINTKEAIINKILEDKGIIEENSKKDACHSVVYYHSLYRLYDKFIDKIKDTILFEHLESGWEYYYGISYDGAELYLDHLEYYGLDGHLRETYCPDQRFTLITVPAKYLTVEEYAELYGTNVSTVRQWIRRAKIRTAKKAGNEWRISELTELPRRGYTTGCYAWEEPLSYVPEEFSFLIGYNSIAIYQEEEKTKFRISLQKYAYPSDEDYRKTISGSEREKLEMYLIGNPEISAIEGSTSPLHDLLVYSSRHYNEES